MQFYSTLNILPIQSSSKFVVIFANFFYVGGLVNFLHNEKKISAFVIWKKMITWTTKRVYIKILIFIGLENCMSRIFPKVLIGNFEILRKFVDFYKKIPPSNPTSQ